MRSNPIGSRHRKPKLICATSTTAFTVPMVIVAMSVLVIAMIIGGPTHSTFDDEAIPALPRATHSIPMPDAALSDAITFRISRDGKLFSGTEQVNTAEMQANINKQLSRGAYRSVYLKVDSRVEYKRVKQVLDVVYSAGIEKIAFLTERPPLLSAETSAPTQFKPATELEWSPDEFPESPDRVGSAWVVAGCIIGVPLGLSGILRRSYMRLNPSRRIYSFND